MGASASTVSRMRKGILTREYPAAVRTLRLLRCKERLLHHDYRYDGLGRRTDVVYSGAAFGGSGNEQLDLWAYNNRNELTGVNRHAGSNPDLPGAEDTDLRRAYNRSEEHTSE